MEWPAHLPIVGGGGVSGGDANGKTVSTNLA